MQDLLPVFTEDTPMRTSAPLLAALLLSTGLFAAYGVAMALFERARTGKGQEARACFR